MPAQFRVYIVRHGETEWNRIRRIQGQSDVPLNEIGAQQAMLVAEALKDVPFERAFSSDLQRTSKVRTLTCRLAHWADPFPDRRMHSSTPSGHRLGTRPIDPGTSKQKLHPLRVVPSSSSALDRHVIVGAVVYGRIARGIQPIKQTSTVGGDHTQLYCERSGLVFEIDPQLRDSHAQGRSTHGTTA